MCALRARREASNTRRRGWSRGERLEGSWRLLVALLIALRAASLDLLRRLCKDLALPAECGAAQPIRGNPMRTGTSGVRYRDWALKARGSRGVSKPVSFLRDVLDHSIWFQTLQPTPILSQTQYITIAQEIRSSGTQCETHNDDNGDGITVSGARHFDQAVDAAERDRRLEDLASLRTTMEQ